MLILNKLARQFGVFFVQKYDLHSAPAQVQSALEIDWRSKRVLAGKNVSIK